jgi:hypothetical protein
MVNCRGESPCPAGYARVSGARPRLPIGFQEGAAVPVQHTTIARALAEDDALPANAKK